MQSAGSGKFPACKTPLNLVVMLSLYSNIYFVLGALGVGRKRWAISIRGAVNAQSMLRTDDRKDESTPVAGALARLTNIRSWLTSGRGGKARLMGLSPSLSGFVSLIRDFRKLSRSEFSCKYKRNVVVVCELWKCGTRCIEWSW